MSGLEADPIFRGGRTAFGKLTATEEGADPTIVEFGGVKINGIEAIRLVSGRT